LFVSNHTLVRALHFSLEQNVYVGSGTLLEAGWVSHHAEEFFVEWDRPKVLLGGACDELGHHADVVLARTHF
jgi:hypothetical protein